MNASLDVVLWVKNVIRFKSDNRCVDLIFYGGGGGGEGELEIEQLKVIFLFFYGVEIEQLEGILYLFLTKGFLLMLHVEISEKLELR